MVFKLSARLGLAAAAALFLAGVPAHAASTAADAAMQYVQRNKQNFGLTGSDVRELSVSSEVLSAHNGITHVYLQQEYRGIEVHNGIFTVNVRKDGSVVSAAGRFVARLASLAGGQGARKDAVEAARAAARDLGLPPGTLIRAIDSRGGPEEATTLSDGGIAARPIEAKLVWLPLAGGGVRLAWRVDIEEPRGDHNWLAFVDAETGRTLAKDDLVDHDEVAAIEGAIAHPAGGPGTLPAFADIDGSSYNVFAFPFESPNDGPRSVVTGAADPAASPFGWHDTNGAAGPEFTRTRGNNAHAYTDIDANNVADVGSDPDGGTELDFDFPVDLTQQPATYRPFAVTNLFYWNNIMHDVTHGYGFDEASGNFQVNNYGNGGLGNDDVRAEAQDGSGTNNANFNTPIDGQRPRMQMFVWGPPLPYLLSIASGPAAGDYTASRAQFGAQLETTGPITGTVVLTNDGAGASTSDGCEPLVGFPAGAIALLDRGNCEFGFKVLTAQNAGAIAAIVVNNAPGSPITMGPGVVGNLVTIPSMMVSQDDGNLVRANVPLTATLRANPTISRDSDLDAGVIAHEYGHGISNRLTGGPLVPGCLGNAEQMGEGWSDWWAITLTARPSDTRLVQRGIGNYVSFLPREGAGIRPTPYSTDMAVNPSTYASVANPAISQPHGIGYVWNTMLWEVYWNLVDRYGYNANVYDPWNTGGNNLALQLVVDGMKFQPCRPGFVDGRNGILAAESALTAGVNRCEIWRGFAKRGLGWSANQGSSENRSDGVQAFDLPASCTTAVFGGFQRPIENPPAINTRDAGADVPVKFTLTGAGSSWSLDSQTIDCSTLIPTGEAPIVIATAPAAQQGTRYHVDWTTDPAWEGTCRRLTLRIPAASDAYAYFSFN